ncbi:hypothetical protein [Candidatus Pseudoscillospira sp. SGI.172]|uniref:hypothetical protein n=1 Tax=Candidatus Pseudoscillospira sp. SGI.172 TaxID=3420582 RepID=UPI0009B9C7CB
MNEEEKKDEVVYATPMKRLWAWVGVVYMVILVLLSTYGLAHGYYLRGIAPLMMVPALCGVGGSAILRYRSGWGRGGLPACILISGASFLLALLDLVRGIPVLIAQL